MCGTGRASKWLALIEADVWGNCCKSLHRAQNRRPSSVAVSRNCKGLSYGRVIVTCHRMQ